MSNNIVKISVNNLVSSIIMSGDLSEEYFQNRDNYYERMSKNAIEQNNKLYTYIDEYVSIITNILENKVELFGHVPGVIIEDEKIILEHFITTFDNIQDLEYDTREQHISILKILAYIYCAKYSLTNIIIKLKYYNIENEEQKSFVFNYSITELNKFFEYIIGIFEEHEYIHSKHYSKFFASMDTFEFPYATFRKGQSFVINKSLETLNENRILYVNAPTGIGKSASFLFSGIKSMTRKMTSCSI